MLVERREAQNPKIKGRSKEMVRYRVTTACSLFLSLFLPIYLSTYRLVSFGALRVYCRHSFRGGSYTHYPSSVLPQSNPFSSLNYLTIKLLVLSHPPMSSIPPSIPPFRSISCFRCRLGCRGNCRRGRFRRCQSPTPVWVLRCPGACGEAGCRTA